MTLLAACGSTETAETHSTPQNKPPTWSDAPTSEIVIGEGQSLSIPLTIADPEGKTPQKSIEAGGLSGGEAEITMDGSAVLVHAGYGMPGKTSFTVVLDDGDGGTAARSSIQPGRGSSSSVAPPMG